MYAFLLQDHVVRAAACFPKLEIEKQRGVRSLLRKQSANHFRLERVPVPNLGSGVEWEKDVGTGSKKGKVMRVYSEIISLTRHTTAFT